MNWLFNMEPQFDVRKSFRAYIFFGNDISNNNRQIYSFACINSYYAFMVRWTWFHNNQIDKVQKKSSCESIQIVVIFHTIILYTRSVWLSHKWRVKWMATWLSDNIFLFVKFSPVRNEKYSKNNN